jgi:lysophospholipase L1-like esterase
MVSTMILLALFVISMLIMSFNFNKKKKIFFLGDSITELGTEPGGYICLINEMIEKEGYAEKLETVGSGINGNGVYDLSLRLEADILSRFPYMVVVYIGINDIWNKIVTNTGTDYEMFGTYYESIINKLMAANCKVLLCTPAVIGEYADGENGLDDDLNLYGNWIISFAEKNSLPYVDLRKKFLQYDQLHNVENKGYGILTLDKIHLTDKGNELVAREIWEAIKKIK